MNKRLETLITATLFLTLTVTGCNKKIITTNTQAPTQEVATTHTVPVASDSNRFRVTLPEQVGNVEVICHNCRAHFKLSQKIQKMSMKGDAIINCPVCHKDYLGKH